MLPNAFAGKTTQPDDDDLSSALGAARVLWDETVLELLAELESGSAEWHSYSAKAGWSLRIRCKERNIVYLVPHAGGFEAAFVLGDRAIAAVSVANVPASVLSIIAGARR